MIMQQFKQMINTEAKQHRLETLCDIRINCIINYSTIGLRQLKATVHWSAAVYHHLHSTVHIIRLHRPRKKIFSCW